MGICDLGQCLQEEHPNLDRPERRGLVAGIRARLAAPYNPAPCSSSWSEAKEEFLRAASEKEDFDRDILTPANDAFDYFYKTAKLHYTDPIFKAAHSIFHTVERWSDVLCERLSQGRDALLRCPAPDSEAVRFKLATLAEDEAWDCVYWEEMFGHVMADLSRLGRSDEDA